MIVMRAEKAKGGECHGCSLGRINSTYNIVHCPGHTIVAVIQQVPARRPLANTPICFSGNDI